VVYNPDFKPLEFEWFRKQAGLNSSVLTPKKWIGSTNAIGLFPEKTKGFKVFDFDNADNNLPERRAAKRTQATIPSGYLSSRITGYPRAAIFTYLCGITIAA